MRFEKKRYCRCFGFYGKIKGVTESTVTTVTTATTVTTETTETTESKVST
jgi:hypothetical protein